MNDQGRKMDGRSKTKTYTQGIAIISMCTAILAVSAWITIPFAINFTMQTFAVFAISALFGWKKSCLSILLYIAIGLCGAPVFSGFGAGISAILGPTGGYLLGFFLIPPIIDLFKLIKKHGKTLLMLSMLIGLAACYTFGTVWYVTAYGSDSESVWSILTVCVLPFIIPDLAKIALAAMISERLSSHIKINR